PDFYPPSGVILQDGTLTGIPQEAGDFPVAIGGADGAEVFVIISIDASPTQSVLGTCGGAIATQTNGFVEALQINLNFAKAGRDSIGLTGKLALPDGFAPAEAFIEFNIGGVDACIKLDAKGAGATIPAVAGAKTLF